MNRLIGRQARVLAAVLAVVAVGSASTVAATTAAPAAGTDTGAAAGPIVPRGAKPLSTARLLFELNASARDAGVQALIDGEGWTSMRMYNPDGKELLRVRAEGSIGKVGMTELFFESAEPSLDDLPLKDLLTMYPEGDYTLVGKTVEGDTLVGIAPLTHHIPGMAKVLGPTGKKADPRNTVVRWQKVTKPSGIKIDHYQVIVERADDPLRIFQVDVNANVTQVAVPPTFLQPHTDYKLEVIAVEKSLNQTLTEGTFSTR